MAIKYNKETGKYYIAPSPPSFYESKKPGSSSGGGFSSSSGGSSSTPTTVPYDFVGPLQPGVTREPAPVVYQGPVQQGTDPDVFRDTGRIVPIGSGGGSSSGGGITTAQVIQDAISRDTANKNVYNYEQNRNFLPSPTCNVFTPIVDKWYKDQQSKTGSFNMPGYNIIKEEEARGGISKNTALKGLGVYYTQEYQSKYSQANQQFTQNLFESEGKKRDTALRYYQGRVNKGEDFKIVTGEYDTYIKTSDAKLLTAQKDFGADWETTIGAKYKGSVNKILYDQALIYDTDKAIGKVKSLFVSGAKTGAVTTGGFQVLQKYAPRVAGFGSKFVAVPIMIGYAGYAYASSGYSGYKNYKTAKSLGFTTSQSVQRGLLSGANTLSGPAFFSAGAVTGGLAVTGTTMAYKNLRMTGRVTGYSSGEQARIDRLLSRKNAFKVDLKKGQVTDVKSSTGGTAGASTRSYNVRLNTQGLRGANLKVANKFNLRGTINQHITNQGGRIKGFEGAKFKTGGMFGKTTTSYTNIQGQIGPKGRVTGLTSSLSNTGRVTTFSYGSFTGKGFVKYPTSITRVEGSNVRSQTHFKADFTRDPTKIIQFGKTGGKWTSWTTDAGGSRGSKIGIGSKFSQGIAYVRPGGSVVAKTYTDTTQWKFRKPVKFDIIKVPSTKSYKGFGGPTSSGKSITFKPTTPASSGGTPPESIIKMRGADGGIVESIYYGKGTYELTNIAGSRMLAPTSTMNINTVQFQTQGPGYISALTTQPTTTQPYDSKIMLPGYNLLQAKNLQLIGPQPLVKTDIKINTYQPANVGRRSAYVQPLVITQPIALVKPIVLQKQLPKQRGRLIQGQPNALLTRGYDFAGRPWPRPRPRIFELPSLPMGAWGQAGFENIKGKESPTSYTPSFTASFFKMTGKKPEGVKTGMGFRPITPGFSFTRKRKIIKIRRIKI